MANNTFHDLKKERTTHLTDLEPFFDLANEPDFVRKVCFENVEIGQENTRQFVNCLIEKTQLRTLIFTGCSFEDGAVGQILHGLIRNKYFHTLDFWNCGLTDDDCTTLSKFLSSNPSLTSLSLTNNAISGLGLRTLASSLALNSRLSTLNVSNNLKIDDIGSLKKPLEQNFALVNLSMGVNASKTNDTMFHIRQKMRDNRKYHGIVFRRLIAMPETEFRLRCLKVMVFGAAGSGKSTLLQSLFTPNSLRKTLVESNLFVTNNMSYPNFNLESKLNLISNLVCTRVSNWLDADLQRSKKEKKNPYTRKRITTTHNSKRSTMIELNLDEHSHLVRSDTSLRQPQKAKRSEPQYKEDVDYLEGAIPFSETVFARIRSAKEKRVVNLNVTEIPHIKGEHADKVYNFELAETFNSLFLIVIDLSAPDLCFLVDAMQRAAKACQYDFSVLNVIIVGAKRDLVDQEQFQAVNMQVEAMVNKARMGDGVVKNRFHNTMVFPVESLAGKGLGLLAEKLNAVACDKEIMDFKMQLREYKLLHAIHEMHGNEEGDYKISMETYHEYATLFNISKEKADTLLQIFCQTGFMKHYETLIPDTIFLRPDFFINGVTQHLNTSSEKVADDMRDKDTSHSIRYILQQLKKIPDPLPFPLL